MPVTEEMARKVALEYARCRFLEHMGTYVTDKEVEDMRRALEWYEEQKPVKCDSSCDHWRRSKYPL